MEMKQSDFLFGTLGLQYSFHYAFIGQQKEEMQVILAVEDSVEDALLEAYPYGGSLQESAQAMMEGLASDRGTGMWGKEDRDGNKTNCFFDREGGFGCILVHPSGGGRYAAVFVSTVGSIKQVHEWLEKGDEQRVRSLLMHFKKVLSRQKHKKEVLMSADSQSGNANSKGGRVFDRLMKGGIAAVAKIACDSGLMEVLIVAEKESSKLLEERYPKGSGYSPQAIAAASSFDYLERIGGKCGGEFCGNGIHALYQQDQSFGVLIVRPQKFGAKAMAFIDGIDEIRELYDYATLINPRDAWEKCCEIAGMIETTSCRQRYDCCDREKRKHLN